MTKTIPNSSLGIIEQACSQNNVVLVDYTIRGHDKRMILDLFIDSPQGVTLEQCSAVNRLLVSQSLVDEFINAVYTLEVSSPGVGKPLKFLWQFEKNIGRLFAIVLDDESEAKGRLVSVSGPDLEFVPIKKKVPKAEVENFVLDFSRIKTAKVEIEF